MLSSGMICNFFYILREINSMYEFTTGGFPNSNRLAAVGRDDVFVVWTEFDDFNH